MSQARTRWMKALDASLGAVICRALAHSPGVRSYGGHPQQRDPIKRVLVLRPGGMGDLIVLLPVLQAIRKGLPGADIDLVCESRNREVLDLLPHIANPLPYDTMPITVIRRLRATDYDLVLDTEQFHHFSAILAYIAGAPTRVGFRINPLRNPLYTHLVDYDPAGPEELQFARLAEVIGISCPAVPPVLADPDCAHATDPRESGPYAAVHVGSAYGGRNWPTRKLAAVLDCLRDEHGLRVKLLGGEGDVKGAAELVANTRTEPEDLTGKLSLQGTTEALRGSAIFLGGDSGVAHLAAAVGVPRVVLFGPSDPGKWGGMEGPTNRILRLAMPCAPCSIFGYRKPCRTHACLADIEVDTVVTACAEVLRAAATAASPSHASTRP